MFKTMSRAITLAAFVFLAGCSGTGKPPEEGKTVDQLLADRRREAEAENS